MRIYFSRTIAAILLLSSCGRTHNNETTTTNDSLPEQAGNPEQSFVKIKTVSSWIIPIVIPLTDPSFAMVIASANRKIPVSHKSASGTASLRSIADTTELRYASSLESRNPCGSETTYYLTNSTASVSSNDVFVVDRLNLGTFTSNGHSLTLGLMKPQYKMDNNVCSSSRLLFFYDDHFLYLIDVNDADENESVHIHDSRHVSLVNTPDNSVFDCASYDNMFEIQWFIPHGRATLRLNFEEGHVMCSEYLEKLTEDPNAVSMKDDIITVECVFSDYSIGDCGHLEFSCGDFGDADSRNLPAADQKLWSSLSVSGPDGESGNPDYIGKTFTIQYRIVQGEICTDPSLPQQGDVQELVSFTMTIVN